MKYPAHIYAKALAEAILGPEKKDEGTIVKNFLAILAKNGDEVHMRKIVEEAARYVREGSGVREVKIETASPLQGAQRTKARSFLKATDFVQEQVNAKLIAGMRITVNNETQFDGSLKAKLDKLFGTA